MTTDSLFDTLETCLQALDRGADVETCLARYPELADELRPVLFAAMEARAASVTEAPAAVARRGKARVLQAAAEMREQRNAAPALPFWRRKGFFGARFYRLALTTAVVIIFLLTGGTGLVNASSGALPGDKLYPVKRSWEGVQLAFVFDQQAKAELEHQFEHERLQEIEELYSEKRFEQVNFQGVVETQQSGMWRISGLEVALEEETTYAGEIAPGAVVQIVGETDDGVIKAERIILVATPGITPTTIPASTSTPQTIQDVTPEGRESPEETETPEVREDNSGNDQSNTGEDAKTPESPSQSDGENETNSSVTGTRRPRTDDSSVDKPNENNDKPSSDGTSDDGSQSTDETETGDH